MPLWRLTPIDLSDLNWEASSHRGPAIVRAPSEQAARDAAQKAFGIKTRFVPGEPIKAPPWKRPQMVKAELIQDQRYPAEGSTEILEPAP